MNQKITQWSFGLIDSTLCGCYGAELSGTSAGIQLATRVGQPIRPHRDPNWPIKLSLPVFLSWCITSPPTSSHIQSGQAWILSFCTFYLQDQHQRLSPVGGSSAEYIKPFDFYFQNWIRSQSATRH